MRPKRVRSVLAAASTVAVAVLGVAPVTAARVAAAQSESSKTPVVIESQSPWVTSGQDFQMRVRLTGGDPGTDKIVVQAFNRLTTRSDFQAALTGRVPGSPHYGAVVVPVSQLQADSQGGYDIDIPVNPTGTAPSQGPGTFPPFSAVGGSGVFPLQVGLYTSSGIQEGRSVTTFLVYGAGQGSATGFPKLNVAVVLPVHAPPTVGSHGEIQAVNPTESARLQQLVAAMLAHQEVPVSIAAVPQTVDALSAGTAADHATVSGLTSLARAGVDEFLPAAYTRVSVGELLGAGLNGELTAQLSQGASSLKKALGATPSQTWVFDGPVDQATISAVLSRGAAHLIVPDGDLTQLPNAARQTTFALPTRLSGVGRGAGPPLYAADPLLTADFNGSGGAVLAADHLLAELAMIQLETPGITRGVAVVPPPRWNADPQFVATLLAGLSGHPLLEAVTASGLFTAVKMTTVQRGLAGSSSGGSSGGGGSGAAPAGGGSSGSPGSTKGTAPAGLSLAGPGGTGLSGDADRIREARRRVDAFQAVLSDQSTAEQLSKALLVAESTDVSAAQRRAILDAVISGSAGVLNQVTLPRSSSITLTSRRGQIPLTILSAGGLKAKVQLQLSSQRLIFRPFSPPGGACRVPTPTTEICDLVVTGQNTTLKVPVEARSSGVFPLDVSLWTPGGGIRLAKEQNTVRSTAVSGVGVILIILAVLSLGLWWGRDLRHGRRARRLVPAPPGPDEPELRLDDPVVREFFANPPPGYLQGGDGQGGEKRAGDPRT